MECSEVENSFAEILARINKGIQIHSTEHDLRQIEGNTIVASKKQQTNAPHSTDHANDQSYALYSKPTTFQYFISELNSACNGGD